MKVLFEQKKGELVLKVIKEENLNIRIDVSYDGKQADAGFYVLLSTDEYLEMLKALIPGKIDDMLIDAIKNNI